MRTTKMLAYWLAAAGCETAARPPLPDGLGQDCSEDADCAEGATCHGYGHPECPDAECHTCEVTCEGDEDCPESLSCNLPPLVPDQVPDICE